MRVLSFALVALVTGWGLQLAAAETKEATTASAAQAPAESPAAAKAPAAPPPGQAVIKPGGASPMSGVLAGKWEFVYAAYILTAAGLLAYIGWTLRAWRQAEGRGDG